MPSPSGRKVRSGQSTLERHPEHVKAIGMISVELANIELHIATLLACLLDRHPRIGHAIYFAPRGAAARLDIVQAVADELKVDHPKLMKQTTSLLKRARTVMNKRHGYIHDVWGIIDESNIVLRGSLPLHKKEGVIVPLAELKTVISDLRSLISDIHQFCPQVHEGIWGISK
jgi:hypothetical protein